MAALAINTSTIYAAEITNNVKYVTAKNGLNIRSAPDIEAEKLTAVPFGTEIEVIESTDDSEWVEVTYQEGKAYVYGKYLGDKRPDVTETSNTALNYLGKFKITYYCNCRKCCGKWAGGATKSGTMPTAGRTIAVDPRVIPLDSQVIIDGVTYAAEDTGSAIKGNKIDIYVSSHQQALELGTKKSDVYIK